MLCGGKKAPSWNYEGIDVTTDDEGRVSGSVRFRSGKSMVESIPLAQTAQNQANHPAPGMVTSTFRTRG